MSKDEDDERAGVSRAAAGVFDEKRLPDLGLPRRRRRVRLGAGRAVGYEGRKGIINRLKYRAALGFVMQWTEERCEIDRMD